MPDTNKAGVIVMRPGSRDKLQDIVDKDGSIFSQLLRSLSVAHAVNIAHCDISPNNCVKFDDKWQVIDYGLATRMETVDSGEVSGAVAIRKRTYQHQCCGYRVRTEVDIQTRLNVWIEWTAQDDVEMLNKCVYGALCQSTGR